MSFDLVALRSPKGRIVQVSRRLTAHRTIGGLVPRLLVIHVAQCAEVQTAAESLADWDAGEQAPRASWHFAVDDDSITQSVLCEDTAWHAGPVNPWSIGIEHAGSAYQTAEQWRDEYSDYLLARSASLVAYLCEVYAIEPRHVGVSELAAWHAGYGPLPCGIVGHDDVTKAISGTHTDPGPHFPWSEYLHRISLL